MEETRPMELERRHTDKKTIQTKVIVGKGEEDFFLEADFDFDTTEAEPFLKIESVDTWVDVYDAQVIKGNKVIFNAWVYKNIVYKTVEGTPTQDSTTGVVTIEGKMKHITKRMPLAGCIDVRGKDRVNPKEDLVEVLDAYVIGDVEESLEPETISSYIKPTINKYKKLHEKMCVKVEVKVVRWEHIEVEVEEKHC